jgi:beta-glucosidase
MRAPLDFVGVNLYTRTIITDVPEDDGLGARPALPFGGDEGPKTDFGWEVWPDALYQMLLRISADYERPEIEITENGCSYGDRPGPDGRVRDARRVEFYRGYLEAVHRAIQAGADVRGYHAWSLLDNFEWGEGYEQRFGLVWIDFETGDRTPKDSARWLGQTAAENGFEV